MGKGNRNRDNRDAEKLEAPQKVKVRKTHKISKERIKSIITIAVTVVVVLGIIAAFMASNGTFRRMQILVKSETGKFNVDRQVATFLAWELEYYSAYLDYMQTQYTDPDASILTQYSSAESFALDYATMRVTDDIRDAAGTVISTPRDAIDNTLPYMINFVAVCDYAHNRGITVSDEEWQGDFTITWLSGMEDTLPVTWNDLINMQVSYGFASLDLFLEEFFGHGLNSKDVAKALKMICLYEKCMAIYMEEVEAGTADTTVMDYILNNPAYFYTTDYLTYQTDNEDLKKALEAATTAEEFKRIIAEDWFDRKGGYKDVFNQYVTVKDAEKLYETIKGKTDTENGTAWSDAISAITGWETVTYKASEKDSLGKELSKWVFKAHSDFGSELIVEEDACYIMTITDADTAVVKDDKGVITEVTVKQKKLDYVDGVAHDGDDAFKDHVKAHMLKKLELLPDEAPSVAFKKALAYAEGYKAELDALEEGADLSEALKAYGDLMKIDNCTFTNSVAPKAVIEKIFGETKYTTGTILLVEEDDRVAYIVHLKTLLASTADGVEAPAAEWTWNIEYVKVESDVFYRVLEQVTTEAKKEIPEDKSATYNAGAAEGSYQKWLFDGATLENGYKNEDRLFDTTVITTTKTSEVDNTETSTHDVYMIIKTSHLDDERVVNGGFYAYTGTNKEAALATLEGKTGNDLIAALQAINASANTNINNATVSETLVKDDVNAAVAEWLFADERQPNQYTAVTDADGRTYFAVYLSREKMYESMGMIYYVSEQTNNWLAGLKANYKASEFVLNLIGDPTPAA